MSDQQNAGKMCPQGQPQNNNNQDRPNIIDEQQNNPAVTITQNNQPQSQQIQTTPHFPIPAPQPQKPSQQIQIQQQQPSQQYFQPYQQAEQQNQLHMYTKKIKSLQQKQEILKCSIAHHQESNKNLFSMLYSKKKQLLELMQNKYNQSEFEVDIGVMEEFTYMKNIIGLQTQQIYKLQQEINKLGLSGVDTDTNTIQLKQKREEYEKEINFGARFASTQYVRDYIQKMHIYKVSYEDVRYEYETKIKLKEQLQIEKKLYDQKKQVLNKNIQQEAKLCEQLEAQRDQLKKAAESYKNKNAK